MPVVEQLFEDIGGGTELGQFACGQAAEMGRKIFDTALPCLPKQALAFSSGTNRHAACVAWIVGDFNQAAAPQSGDNAAHGGRLDLLGGGEFPELLGAGKDKNGKSGELRRSYARGRILLANAAQQVDGGGMKAVGGDDRFWTGRDFFGLDFCHQI